MDCIANQAGFKFNFCIQAKIKSEMTKTNELNRISLLRHGFMRIFGRMSDLFNRIRSIEERVVKLLQSFNELKGANRRLLFENTELNKEKIRLKELIVQANIAREAAEEKLRKDSEREESVTEVKIELKHYISEIDNCLELLQN